MIGSTFTVAADVFSEVSPSDNRTYNLQGNDLVSSAYGDPTSTVDEPATAKISHEVTNQGLERHLVRFDKTKLGLDGVTPKTASAYFVSAVPRGAGFTDEELEGLAAQLVRFLYDSPRFQKLLNGEV